MTMKRKGFTLIELLAVIVILAIVSIIATPTILGVIEKARKGAAKQSALEYIDAVEKQVAINQVKNENLINDGTYNVPMTGITVKGEAPTKGWLKIEKGLVTNYSFVIGKYVITKGSEIVKGDEPAKSEEEFTKTGPTQELGKESDTYKAIVYLDPTDLTKYCDASNSVSTTGTKEGCMKWYAYSDDGTNYNMILDHNTTAKIAYNSTINNSEMKEVKEALEEDSKKWSNSLNSRLITADEIATITGNKNFNSSTATIDSWFYLDSNNQTQTATSQGASKYAWLFDYTKGCTNGGCNVTDDSTYGYWTSTPVFGSIYNAWYMNSNDNLNNYYYVSHDDFFGLRPVITVSKDIIQ